MREKEVRRHGALQVLIVIVSIVLLSVIYIPDIEAEGFVEPNFRINLHDVHWRNFIPLEFNVNYTFRGNVTVDHPWDIEGLNFTVYLGLGIYWDHYIPSEIVLNENRTVVDFHFNLTVPGEEELCLHNKSMHTDWVVIVGGDWKANFGYYKGDILPPRFLISFQCHHQVEVDKEYHEIELTDFNYGYVEFNLTNLGYPGYDWIHVDCENLSRKLGLMDVMAVDGNESHWRNIIKMETGDQVNILIAFWTMYNITEDEEFTGHINITTNLKPGHEVSPLQKHVIVKVRLKKTEDETVNDEKGMIDRIDIDFALGIVMGILMIISFLLLFLIFKKDTMIKPNKKTILER